VKFRFGQVVGIDYEVGLRAMVLAQYHDKVWAKETWCAVVLTDDERNPDHWEVGRIITVSPHTAGIVIYEEA
jgi:hypothetical protein